LKNDQSDLTRSAAGAADDARRARAAARRQWPIRGYRLGEEPGEDLSATTTAAERMAMVWRLSLDAWAMTGRPLPNYRREDTPGRVIRPGDADADD
jgi:hypothetical protein